VSAVAFVVAVAALGLGAVTPARGVGVAHSIALTAGGGGARAIERLASAACPAGEQVRVVRTRATVVRREVVGGRVTLRRVLAWTTSATCASVYAPAPGASTYWASGTPGSYGNTGTGAVADCTVAAAADLEQIFTHSARPLPAAPWIDAYTAMLAAQDPGQSPGPDAPLAVPAVLATWQSTGIAGTRVAAVSSVALGQSSIEAALRQGPLYAVVDLPAPSDPGTPPLVDASYVALAEWSPGHPGTGYFAPGAHALAVVGFDHSAVLLETWGYVQPVSWSWWATYAMEAFAVHPSSPVSPAPSPAMTTPAGTAAASS
jgi:hypothetical protein